jgi:hypothetical protein
LIDGCVRQFIVVLALLTLPMSAQAERVFVALGTSLTLRSIWLDELISALKPCFPEGVRLERVAAVGKGSDWGVASLHKVIAAKPDVVIIEFAINDADFLDGVSISRSRINHLAMIDTLYGASPDVRIALVTTNPAFGPRGWIRPWLDDYYEVYREIAAEKDVRLIDIYFQWCSILRAEDRRRLIPDGLHPTDSAMREIGLPIMRMTILEMLAPEGKRCK